MASAEKDRVRVLKACLGCKASRRKCDGNQPCEYCGKRGIECEYDDAEPKKRGPKRGSRQLKLEEENERLRHELAVMKAAVSGGTHHGTHTPAHTHDTESMSSGSASCSGSGAKTPLSSASVPVRLPPAKKQRGEASPLGGGMGPTTTQLGGKRRVASTPVPTLDNTDALNAAAAILTLSGSPDPKTLLQSTIWLPPGKIIPSSEEEALLRTFFEYANRILPVVEESYFYASLSEAQYYPDQDPEEVAAMNGVAKPTPALPSLLAKVEGARARRPFENPLYTMDRNSEVFGFRVCYYTLLCVGAKVQGRYKLAKRYFELARAFIGPCFSQPSQHLVSALLLMTMITRAICSDISQAALHSALALKMSELVDVTPEIRMVAQLFNYACAATPGFKWPPLVAAPDVPPHHRFAVIVGFCIHQVISDFANVTNAEEQATLTALFDEALALQAQLGILSSFPLKPIALGMSALLHKRANNVVLALEEARKAIEMAAADRLARFCFPCVVVIAKLMPILKEIMEMPEFGEAAADKTKALKATACTFLKEAPQTFGGCPQVAAAKQGMCGGAGGGSGGGGGGDGACGDASSSDEACESECTGEGGKSAGGRCDGSAPVDLLGIIGHTVLKTVCPVTGKVQERKVLANQTSSTPSTVASTVDGNVVHDDGSISRSSAELDAKRKAPVYTHAAHHAHPGPTSDAAHPSASFLPTEMMRISAAMAPRASLIHPIGIPVPLTARGGTGGAGGGGGSSARRVSALIPDLMDEPGGGGSAHGSVSQSRALGLFAMDAGGGGGGGRTSPIGSFAAMSVDEQGFPRLSAFNSGRLERMTSFGSVSAGAPLHSSHAFIAPGLPRMTSYEHYGSAPTGGSGGGMESGRVDAMDSSSVRDDEFMNLAQRAYGDVVMAEFDRRPEVEAGSDASGMNDDSGSVTSLGLHLSAANGLFAGIPTDLTALANY